MRDKAKRLSVRTAIATLAAACITALVGIAGTATATAAQWNELGPNGSASDVIIEGTLTASPRFPAGASPPVLCNISIDDAIIDNNGEAWLMANSLTTCANGKVLRYDLDAWATSTVLNNYHPQDIGPAIQSPVGPFFYYRPDVEYGIPLVNGTGGDNTKLVFNNLLVGSAYTGLRLTGNLEIKNPTGGTYTVSP